MKLSGNSCGRNYGRIGVYALAIFAILFTAKPLSVFAAEAKKPAASEKQQSKQDSSTSGKAKADTKKPIPKTNVVVDLRPAIIAARKATLEGDYEKADKLYGLVTKAFPKLSDIRLEYAAATARAGETEKSRDIMAPIDIASLPAGHRNAYNNLMWGERGFSISAAPKILYDTNVNSGATNGTVMIGGIPFTLSEDAQASGGMGYGGMLSVQGLHVLNNKTALGFTALADADIYENSDFSGTRFTLSAGPRFVVGKSIVRLNALAGTRFLGGDHLEDHHGGQGSITFNTVDKIPLTLSASRRIFEGAEDNTPNRDRTEDSYVASLFFRDHLPWKGGASLFVGYDSKNWIRSIEDNIAYKAGFSTSFPRNGYVDPVFFFSVSKTEYENKIPLLGVARDEWRYEPSIRFDITYIKTPFGSPYVQYSYIRNDSNVVLTDYDQHRVTTGFVIRSW
jgi:hypothetical protein